MSLANKCQVLVALAVALMLLAGGAIVWARFAQLVADTPRQRARDLAEALVLQGIDPRQAAEAERWMSPDQLPDVITLPSEVAEDQFSVEWVPAERLPAAEAGDAFLAAAVERFELRIDAIDAFEETTDLLGRGLYRYARAVRRSDLAKSSGARDAPFLATLDAPAVADPLEYVILIQMHDDQTARQTALNTLYLGGAALAAGLVAVLMFWLILSRLVLVPVRLLRNYAERVHAGESNLRAEIHTGDEYQRLADMFNDMLDRARKNDAELRALNKGLDLKLGELAESNVALYEANKVKGEFLANVSHELRTPLNSIAGFAEVLRDTLPATGDDARDEKRRRYAENILISSKRLLDLINDLLDLAKIEAGRLELRVGPLSIADTCEGLLTLIRPMAEDRGVRLKLKIEPNLPLIETDAGRLQQIVFNFLSNAVKFTPRGGSVTLLASKLAGEEEDEPSIRIAVSDTGPGIAPEDHQRIFEKFTQLDASVTKQQGGTGLGLTISRDLAELLQGTIEVESAAGRGATFSLTIPYSIKARTIPLMPEAE